MGQRSLSSILTPAPIRIAEGRADPTLWIRRVRILRELTTDPAALIREVELRRGLNVIWAPPRAAHASGLSGDGIVGHTAGKTTFCRLLRYVLGEGRFASEGTRVRIRERLPNAWVLAEVLLCGECWAVARPLGHGARPFAMRGVTLSEAVASVVRPEYRAFLDALGEAATRNLSATRFPHGAGEPIGWTHLLPWLARDQECRFGKVLEWRDPSSDSDAPALTLDDRHFVVRAVLGLISDAEREEQQQHSTLRTRRRKAEAHFPLLQHQTDVDRQRLETALDNRFTAGSDLDTYGIRQELDRRRVDVVARRRKLHAEDPRPAHASAQDEALLTRDRITQELNALEEILKSQRKTLEEVERDVGGERGSKLLASVMQPGRMYCAQLMTTARRAECPLASANPVDLSLKIGELTMNRAGFGGGSVS